VADLSGIELRVNHFLWKVESSMSLFKADPEKADLYKDFASKLYEKPVGEVTKEERQVGKVAHLGLGFGAGAKTFQNVAKLMGGVDLSEEESQNVVDKWRNTYDDIKQGWRTCHDMLPWMLEMEVRVFWHRPLGAMHNDVGRHQDADGHDSLPTSA